MDAADCRLVAGVAEWFFGEVLHDVRLRPAGLRSVDPAELMAGMLW